MLNFVQLKKLGRVLKLKFMKKIIAFLLTLSIPCFLLLNVWQSSRCINKEKVRIDYDKEQYRLIEENKRKISGIAILLRNERIEKIAKNYLNMRKANSDEIIRIEFDRQLLQEADDE